METELDPMWLEDTVEDMISNDYTRRMKAEINQLRIRYYRLKHMFDLYKRGLLDFQPTNVHLLCEQEKAMKTYLEILIERAKEEGVEWKQS